MKKRIIALFTVLMMAVGPAIGQIILTDEDAGLNPRTSSDGSLGVMVPMQNTHIDQWKVEYVPVGNGLVVLLGLGGAYLLKKRKDKR